ncbi:MAG: OmpH family outer membrane protein [Deltaproteobacteria bacterium]|jgi:outer membrane protein|nr:OmpH family outer membrane protein [Deltaproteobacteria bacterium]
MPIRQTSLILASLAAFALFWSGAVVALAQDATDGFTVGVVDSRRAVNDSKQGKAANAKLKTKFDSLKKALDAKQADLEKKGQDLQNQARTLAPDALDKRRQDLMTQYAKFQEESQKATEDMQKAFEEAMVPIDNKAKELIAQIARERKYNLILDASLGGVLFYEPGYDMTDELIRRLDGGK